jgi:hypothetical protein
MEIAHRETPLDSLLGRLVHLERPDKLVPLVCLDNRSLEDLERLDNLKHLEHQDYRLGSRIRSHLLDSLAVYMRPCLVAVLALHHYQQGCPMVVLLASAEP